MMTAYSSPHPLARRADGVPSSEGFHVPGTTMMRQSIVSRWAIMLFYVAMTAVAVLITSTTLEGADPVTDAHSTDVTPTDSRGVAIFAGGCFWCTEAVFERMIGVQNVESGYIGGLNPNPTYTAVCTGTTGHAEAVRIFYNPTETTFEELLEVFFKTHDPTSLNRQGADAGTQYRSSVFYFNDEQKLATQKMIDKYNASSEFGKPVVTQLEPATTFYVAEEYHQDYFRLNPNAGYCRAVVSEKVRKFNNTFGDKIKPEAAARP